MKLSARSVSFVVVLGSAISSAFAAAQNSPVVWIAPSLHRVGMSDVPGEGTEAVLSAARGEYESFQIVVSGAAQGARNVNVTISDLQGPGGRVIPRANFTLYREKYVYVSSASPNWKGSNQPL